MAEKRKLYDVEIGGVVHQMLLDDDDAERYGALARPSAVGAKSAQPANKAAVPGNK